MSQSPKLKRVRDIINNTGILIWPQNAGNSVSENVNVNVPQNPLQGDCLKQSV